jgi:transcriptional regulator with XRE-family HTH domain
MEKLKRLREASGLSQVKLAARADLNPATVNQIERGMRDASPGTLRKLADALGVSLYELMEEEAPKAQAPLSPETQQRRSTSAEGELDIQALVRQRLSRFDREVNDPESTKFKSATLATDWLTDVQNEATDWITWGLNNAVASEASTVDTLRAGLWALGLITEIGRIKRLAERRIKANQEPPDELARKRAEVASRELQEAGRRLQEFQAASG